MGKTKKEISFEEQLKRLEEIVEALDKSDAPLDELLSIFEEGMKLAQSCREFLEKAEQKVIEITNESQTQDNENSAIEEGKIQDDELDEQESSDENIENEKMN